MAGDPETTEFCVYHGWSGSRGVDGREVSCSARTCGTMIGLPHAISALFTYRTVGLGFNLFNHPTKARRRTLPIAKGERFKNCKTELYVHAGSTVAQSTLQLQRDCIDVQVIESVAGASNQGLHVAGQTK